MVWGVGCTLVIPVCKGFVTFSGVMDEPVKLRCFHGMLLGT